MERRPLRPRRRLTKMDEYIGFWVLNIFCEHGSGDPYDYEHNFDMIYAYGDGIEGRDGNGRSYSVYDYREG